MPTGNALGNTFSNDLLKLIFQAVAIAGIAENATISPLTNLYVSLHTADPGEAGTQQTNEIAYTGYARIAVARSAAGWTVTNNSVSPVADITFPAYGGGAGGTVTHFGVGTVDLATGAGKLLFGSGCTVTPNIVVGAGVTPILTTATAITLN